MPGSAEPDRHAYERIFNAFYRGFFDAGAQLAVVHPAQPFERFPVLVVPALYIADDALLGRLVAVAEAGGHLLVSLPLATYDHRHSGRFAAATTHRFGQGQVT